MIDKFVSRVLNIPKIAIATLLAIFPASLVTADTSNVDYLFLVDPDRQSCQQMGTNYQEVKAFETLNYRIHICQKDKNYYYLGETKVAGIDKTIFLPANALESGDIYQASNGNITYIVSVLPNEALLTIERNGALVLVESSLNNSECMKLNALSPVIGGVASNANYPLKDVQIISNRSYIDINQLDINLMMTKNNLSNYNFLAEYNTEAILNSPICN